MHVECTWRRNGRGFLSERMRVYSQEVIARYLNSGDRVFMCLYDLQKAFDSVKYPVLLDRLYEMVRCGGW